MADSCGHDKASNAEPRRIPELLGVVDVSPVADTAGSYRFALPHKTKGEFTLLLECHVPDLPFEQYCRFVRHPGEGHPYTFSSMEFHRNPPGLRVGPWPGWRGIPEFPIVRALSGSADIVLQPAFWGDESTCGLLRMFGRFSRAEDYVVTVTVSDFRIIPFRVSIYRTEALKARPHSTGLLPDLVGVHPRLLITPSILPLLRARATGSHRHLWRNVLAVWENHELPFAKSPESKCVPGPERLSGEDRVLLSALMALVTEKNARISQALQAYGDYVYQTGRGDFEPLGIDTQAGEVLFILSVGFDWLYAWLSESERKAAWERIEHVAGICSSFLTPQRSDYGQAHYLGCGLGLLAYSFLAPEESASSGLARLRGAFDCALELLSSDGSYPHGINLWIYEFGFLLRWMELFRTCSGEDLWASRGSSLARAACFRAATLSSDARCGLTFGDPQYRVGGDSWCHFLIAARTGSGIAQWLGERLADQPQEGVDFRSIPPRRRVYEFLFYESMVTATPPAPGVRVFPDIGQVTIRSSRTYYSMRSGPPLGIARYASGEYGAYGHSDPASGSFLLERGGSLTVSGPGPVYRRDTSLHNVVTIDGKGQIGDSTVWLPDFLPPEALPPRPDVNTDGTIASLFVDLTKAYLPCLGVKGCTRAVFVDPEQLVLGVDEVECDAERSIEWNMHSRSAFSKRAGDKVMAFDIGPDVRLVLLSPRDAECETGRTDFVPAYPNDGTRDYRFRMSVKSTRARFVWCFLFGSRPLPEIREEEEETFTVRFAGGLLLYFDGRRFHHKREP